MEFGARFKWIFVSVFLMFLIFGMYFTFLPFLSVEEPEIITFEEANTNITIKPQPIFRHYYALEYKNLTYNVEVFGFNNNHESNLFFDNYLLYFSTQIQSSSPFPLDFADKSMKILTTHNTTGFIFVKDRFIFIVSGNENSLEGVAKWLVGKY